MPPLLTIAVPTFNRLADLKVCLQSILSAISGVETGKVELIVSSNASGDGTDEWISSLDTSGITFSYHRWESNVGPIRNFLKLVELAQGDWLWFVSDDDAVTPDAVRLLLGILRETPAPAGITLSCIPCDSDLRPIHGQIPDPQAIPQPFIRDTAPYSHSQLREYLHEWGLLTLCVFPVARWRQILPQLPIPKEDCYPHVWVQSLMLAESSTWIRIIQPTVLYRGDRDSFLAAQGALKRALMPITTYGHLAEYYQNNHPAIAQACRDLSCSFIYHYAMKFKTGWVAPKKLTAQTYYSLLHAGITVKAWKHPKFFSKSIPALLIPACVIRLLKKNRRKSP
jgi:abequosyltransferase